MLLVCRVILQYHCVFMSDAMFLSCSNMKVHEETVKSAGLTLLYEPDWPIEPAVDIVLVHGIGGHPVRSWKCQNQEQKPATPKVTVPAPGSLKRRLTKLPPETPLRRSNSEPLPARRPPLSRPRTLLWNNRTESPSRLNFNGFVEPNRPCLPGRSKTLLRKTSPDLDAYWPLDFLPASCPNSRIFTWGYHTPITNKQSLHFQGNIFAHAGELLVGLASTRAALGSGARPIIFVAHSTGGVLVKELLRLSEAERDGPLKEILLSTSAVVFLGSPHRGTEQYNLRDAVKSMAGAVFGIGPHDPVLEELCGTNAVEMELSRQAFVRLWNAYNFKVKTFQESIIPTYHNPVLRAETTLRRLASFLGDPRENAETICALHDNICRFGSADEPGYRALARSLAAFITREEEERHILNAKETGEFSDGFQGSAAYGSRMPRHSRSIPIRRSPSTSSQPIPGHMPLAERLARISDLAPS
ncbi:hypothetical protein VTI74DRAFT_4721 [Chaetomium olivicolor]